MRQMQYNFNAVDLYLFKFITFVACYFVQFPV